MKLFLIKRRETCDKYCQQFLEPYANSDSGELQKLAYNTVVKCVISRPRNWKHHKKYYALCQMILDNKDCFVSVEQVSFWLKIKTGCVYTCEVAGETIIIPKSINFESMAQDEFEEYYNNCLPFVCELLGVSVEAIGENEVFNL